MPRKSYKVVCISLYEENLQEIDEVVSALKTKGYNKANRSWLIRQAIHHFDPAVLPEPWLV